MTQESREVLGAVIRAMEKATTSYYLDNEEEIEPFVNPEVFIQALKDELK